MIKNKKIYNGIDISELPKLYENDFGDLGFYSRNAKNEKIKNLASNSYELSKAFIQRTNKILNDPTRTQEAKIVMLHNEGKELKKTINDNFIDIAHELQVQMKKAQSGLFSEEATLSSAEEAMLPQYVQMLSAEKKGSYQDIVTNPSEAKIILHLMKHNPSLIPEELKKYDIDTINSIHSKEAQDLLNEATSDNIMDVLSITEKQIEKIAPLNVITAINELVV